MEFRKKLKLRLCINLLWAVIGIALILYWFLSETANDYSFSLGVAFIVIGVIRFIQYRHATSSEQAMRKKEVAEFDERTRMIAEQARSWTFSLSLTAAGIWVILLSLLGRHEEARPYAWYVCAMVVLYWICFVIIRKKY